MTLDLVAYMAATGRPPHLGESPPPWRYRGWLAFYVQELHSSDSCSFPDRWGYLYEITATGKLPDRPIPYVHFHSAHDGAGAKAAMDNLDGVLKLIMAKQSGWSALRILCEWLEWGLASRPSNDAVYPAELEGDDELAEALYRALDLSLWLEAPADYLGTITAENASSGKWNPNAFYPTPHAVVEAMTQIVGHDLEGAAAPAAWRPRHLPDGRDTRLASVCDPCAGTGRMLLHASNYSLNLYAQDIDPFVLRILRINGAVYAPWLSHGIPAHLRESAQEAT